MLIKLTEWNISLTHHPALTYRVGVEGLSVHLVVVVLAGQVEQDTEGEVQVVRLTQPSLVPQANQGTLLKYFDFSPVKTT